MEEINHKILSDPARTKWGFFSYTLDLLDRLTADNDADQQKIKNRLMGKKILALLRIDGYWCVVSFLGVKKLGEKKTRGEMLTVSAVCFLCCLHLAEFVTVNAFGFNLSKTKDKIKFLCRLVTFREGSFLTPRKMFVWKSLPKSQRHRLQNHIFGQTLTCLFSQNASIENHCM